MVVRKVAGQAVFVMISTAALALMQWGMMVVIARVDGPSMLAYYALAQAFATPIGYFAWLGMRQHYLVAHEAELSFADCLLIRIILPGLAFLLLFAFLAWFYAIPSLTTISIGVLAIKYAEGLFDLSYGPMQQAGNARLVAMNAVIRVLLSFCMFLAVYLGTRNLSMALLGVAVLWLLLFILQRKHLGVSMPMEEIFTFSRKRFQKLASFTTKLASLGLGITVMSFAVNSPRFLIERSLNVEDLGYFAASYHFLAMGSVVVGSLGHAILPTQSRSVREDNARAFWLSMIWSSLLMLAGSAFGVTIAWFFGSDIMRIFYGKSFAGQGYLLVWAAAVAGPVYAATLLVNGFQATRRLGAFLGTQLAVLATIVVATLILVPHLGLKAAYLGVLAGALVQSLISVVVLLKFWRTHAATGANE